MKTQARREAQNQIPVEQMAGIIHAEVLPKSQRLLSLSRSQSSQFRRLQEQLRRQRLAIKVSSQSKLRICGWNLIYAASTSSTTLSSAPPQSSRPRLVAKTTSGLRDSAAKAAASGAKTGGTAPDPSQVWNKNRRRCKDCSVHGEKLLTVYFI